MTSNQKRAARLAAALRADAGRTADLTDADWDLLLLAAGLTGGGALRLLVANRVLDRARRRVGYFADPGWTAAADAGGRITDDRITDDGRRLPSRN